MKIITGYKFIKQDMKSSEGNCTWKVGEWKKHDGDIELCISGHKISEKAQRLELRNYQ